ncbi:hypothetical protein BD410DRAFT_869202 [Rickenella mellea]|uniref:Uncharacterized protein n=1 Tax=Rickenella mellea TaxID=50990 RepID=A0A4Y7QJC0_9AGAM|nr:hypothetical protein BD410DRAFT_869202 [Rickenella mellea]
MCDRALDTTDEQVEDMKEELINHYKGQIIHASKEILEGYRGDTLEWDSKVEWITPMKSTTQLSSTYIAYGSEASLGHIYGDVSLIVYIGVPGDRLNASSIEAFDYKTEYKVRSSKRKRVAK